MIQTISLLPGITLRIYPDTRFKQGCLSVQLLRPMRREEAIMQMNLLNHSFFAFRDEDNGGCFAVVYRRNDGGYGLIDDVE